MNGKIKSIRNNLGFSLIELMVGMALGLIGLVVIGQVFSVTEAGKRSTTSGGDAVQNGALALYLLDKDIAQSGFGFVDPEVLGCTVKAFSEQLSQAYTYTLAPVFITQGTGSAPDTINVAYANNSRVSSKTRLAANLTSPTALYQVRSNYGFNPGDIIIIGEIGKFCTQSQVTAVTTTVVSATSPATYSITHQAAAPYTDIYGNPKISNFNRSGGEPLPTTPTAGYLANEARVYNLSNAAVNKTYKILNGNLISTSGGSSSNDIIATGILDLQAQYGIDTVNDDNPIVNSYTSTNPTTPAGWSNVLSIRYGLIARASKLEKQCSTTNPITATVPTWSGGAFNNITADTNWQCYRYRVFEGTTVMRDMIWKGGNDAN